MVVLEFAFSEGLRGLQQPGGNETDRVICTGTHDDDTRVGWWEHATPAERANVERALAAARVDEGQPRWALIRLAHRSPARLSLIAAEDLLGLGSGRMKTPGKTHGNWAWRLTPGELRDDLARRTRELTVATQCLDRKRP